MTIRALLKMGDPRLLEVSAAVDVIDAAILQPLLTDMWDTMTAENGAGLAAPQIGVMQRVVIFGFDDNPRYAEARAAAEGNALIANVGWGVAGAGAAATVVFAILEMVSGAPDEGVAVAPTVLPEGAGATLRLLF